MTQPSTAPRGIDRAVRPDAQPPIDRTVAPPRRTAQPNVSVRPRRFWIVVIGADAAAALAAHGHLQLGSGKAGPLERMRGGDGFALYSPRAGARREAVQAFTAIGRVRDAPIEIAGGAPDGAFRRAAEYLPACAAPIRPLLPELTFIRNPAQWGAVFRFGVVRVPDADFARIARAMGRTLHTDFPSDLERFAPIADDPSSTPASR
jgi:hypothetical protein